MKLCREKKQRNVFTFSIAYNFIFNRKHITAKLKHSKLQSYKVLRFDNFQGLQVSLLCYEN